MSDFLFGGKAATLQALAGRLRRGRLPPQTVVTAAAWSADRDGEIARVLAMAWAEGARLIARSSAHGEDAGQGSQAGRYLSVPDIAGPTALARALDAVFASYGRAAGAEPGDHVLIQPFLENVVCSGVATSRELGSGRPYIVVNWSDGADTAAVTAGRSNDTFTHYHFRGALEVPPGRIGAVIALLREIEEITQSKRLDIEFAFLDGDLTPVLLQARPLAEPVTPHLARDVHARMLRSAQDKVRTVLEPHPLAPGRRSALGVMPDWNPAEMIGLRPRPLSLSLYRGLVTDEVWARQRRSYGYRDLRGFPLLIDICGQPFIDVRASFDSFVPSALGEGAAARLVDIYLDRLLARPELHDKVEFEIVLSVYGFDIETRLEALRRDGFSAAEAGALRAALHALTARLLDVAKSPRRADLTQLATLQERRAQLMASDLAPLTKAYWLLEDCKTFGTRPFAGLARLGFVAMELLNSMVAVGALDPAQRADVLMGVETVAGELQRDLAALPRAAFLTQYGHLRPGAYDILSPRYDEAPDLYFGAFTACEPMPAARQGLAEAGRAALAAAAGPLLSRHGFSVTPEQLVDFIVAGVREREWAKFAFTRNVSDALSALKAWGAEAGLTAEDLSYVDIGVLREIHASAKDPMDLICASSRAGREAYRATASTCLPPLIVSPDQVWSFTMPPAAPNFVTARSVRAPVAKTLSGAALTGAIAMIANADPGFDWIFAHAPAALITAYGGANSHMAIRAAELGLPAVIGAGERLFGAWSGARTLLVDCANRRVEAGPC